MIIDKGKLDCYRHNIETRRWIPWEEYLNLNVGDKIELPYYEYDSDKPNGKQIYKIDDLYRDSDDNLEIGGYCAKVTRIFFDGKKEEWMSGGTLSVNLDDVYCEEEICPSDEIIAKIVYLMDKGGFTLKSYPTNDMVEYIKQHWN